MEAVHSSSRSIRRALLPVPFHKLFEISDHPADEEVEFLLGQTFAEGRHRVVRAVEFFVAGFAEELSKPTLASVTGQSRACTDFAEQLVFADRLQRVAVDAVRLKLADGEFAGLENLTSAFR